MLRHPEAAAAVVEVPVLLSIADAAQLLGCSPRTLRRRISDGQLTAVIDHGLMRVRGDDLRAYIDALPTVGARPPRRRRRRRRSTSSDDDPIAYLRR